MKAVLVDIGGVLEVTPVSYWAEKWEARLGHLGARKLSRIRPLGSAVTARSFGAGETARRVSADEGDSSRYRPQESVLFWIRPLVGAGLEGMRRGRVGVTS